MKKSLLGFLVVGLIFLGVLWQAHSDQMESMEAYMTASERYSMDYQPIPIEGSADIINKPVFFSRRLSSFLRKITTSPSHNRKA